MRRWGSGQWIVVDSHTVLRFITARC